MVVRFEESYLRSELFAIQNCLEIAEKSPVDREISISNAKEYVAELLTKTN